jgi:hypothetical protein
VKGWESGHACRGIGGGTAGLQGRPRKALGERRYGRISESWVAGSDDERALSELYERYGGLIYGAGTRYLGDHTLAENLVQDALLSVWHHTAVFDSARASFATWVIA